MSISIKKSFHILLISLLLVCAPSLLWSQENKPEDNAAKDGAQDNSDDSKADGESVPQKPHRLRGDLPRPRSPANESNEMEVLAQYFPEEAQLWLETDQGRFLSFWQQKRSAESKGALLIIHAEGEHPAWPKIHQPLHDSLPDHGWSTLAISIPPPKKEPTPKRSFPVKTKPVIKMETEEETKEEQEGDKTESTEATKKEADIKEPPTPESKKKEENVAPAVGNTLSPEEVVEKRLEAAIAFLHDKGLFNIIMVGSGSGAIRAHRFINQITPKIDNPTLKAKFKKPVHALIMINATNQLSDTEEPYTEWFNDPSIPVLDIYLKDGYSNESDAKMRKILAKQKRVETYEQVAISSLNSETHWDQNKLSRRIRGFLEKKVAGIEINRSKYQRAKNN